MVLFKWSLLITFLVLHCYLHSTMVLFKSVVANLRPCNYKFTFHYGPIQILFALLKRYWKVEFTFHYGPIQIECSTFEDLLYNVFTFHYGPIQMTLYDISHIITSIYIPLWSYSNVLSAPSIVAINSFTFHYGPIQIVIRSRLKLSFQNLHSTMVLFKSILSPPFFFEFKDLHSTMVLFKLT